MLDNNSSSARASGSSAGGSSANGDSGENSSIQNNMTINVNYVYSLDQITNSAASLRSLDSNDPNTRTGTLSLNVPNIPTNRTDSQFRELMQFAASIAILAIASSIKKKHGVPMDVFKKFPVADYSELTDTCCPICFDEYVVPERKAVALDDEVNENGKRSRDDDDETTEGELKVKKSKPNNEQHQQQEEHQQHQQQEAKQNEKQEEFPHIGIKLPCNHVFGQNCLYEWLKSNCTCPLCRSEVYKGDPLPSTLNFPNLSSIINSDLQLNTQSGESSNNDSNDNSDTSGARTNTSINTTTTTTTTPQRPIVIILDRATNTLRPRVSNDDNTTNNSDNDNDNIPNRIRTVTPRLFFASEDSEEGRSSSASAVTSAAANNSNNNNNNNSNNTSNEGITRNFSSFLPGLFPNGVFSRRSGHRIENNEEFNNFYSFTRRLIQQRLDSINNSEQENNEQSEQDEHITQESQSHHD